MGKDDRLINGRAVTELTSYSKSTRNRMMARGEFPKPVIQNPNDSRWSYAEVMAWVELQKANRTSREPQRVAA